MIVHHLIIPIIMIIGGAAILLTPCQKVLAGNNLQIRGFVRSMRLWGVLWICYGAIDIALHYDHTLSESKAPTVLLLRVCERQLGGALLGMILALIVSGQWAAFFRYEKEIKRQSKPI